MDKPKAVAEFDTKRDPVQSPTVRQVMAEDKAMILCWMWLADLVIGKQTFLEPESYDLGIAAKIARDIINKMFKLDITAQSIGNYYLSNRRDAASNGFECDDLVAVRIMDLRGWLKYQEFKDFLDEYESRVSTNTPLYFWRVRAICTLLPF